MRQVVVNFALDRQRERKEGGTRPGPVHRKQSEWDARKNGQVPGRREVRNGRCGNFPWLRGTARRWLYAPSATHRQQLPIVAPQRPRAGCPVCPDAGADVWEPVWPAPDLHTICMLYPTISPIVEMFWALRFWDENPGLEGGFTQQLQPRFCVDLGKISLQSRAIFRSIRPLLVE